MWWTPLWSTDYCDVIVNVGVAEAHWGGQIPLRDAVSEEEEEEEEEEEL
jgi:hypothetical protein